MVKLVDALDSKANTAKGGNPYQSRLSAFLLDSYVVVGFVRDLFGSVLGCDHFKMTTVNALEFRDRN